MKTVTALQMAEIDRRAQEEYGVSQDELMESAGKSVFEEMCSDLGPLEGKNIAILCGKGNNGGDGFVIARYLSDESPGGITVYSEKEEKIKEGSARDNFIRMREAGVPVKRAEDFHLPEGGGLSAFVDSLFGTGFQGKLPEVYAEIAGRVNSSGVKVYSVDVPSGLNATTGEVQGECFRASKTITFGLAKKGFYEDKGPEYCGEVVVKKIGFPEELLEEYK